MLALVTQPGSAATPVLGPFDRQVAENLARLSSHSPSERAGAAEAWGISAHYAAEDALIRRLRDESPARPTRGGHGAWPGRAGENAIPKLLAVLDDDDWLTRRAAQRFSLTNLTGMEFPLTLPRRPTTGPRRPKRGATGGRACRPTGLRTTCWLS